MLFNAKNEVLWIKLMQNDLPREPGEDNPALDSVRQVLDGSSLALAGDTVATNHLFHNKPYFVGDHSILLKKVPTAIVERHEEKIL